MPYDPDDDQPPLDPPVDQEEDRPDAETIIRAHLNDQAQRVQTSRQDALIDQGDNNPGASMYGEDNPGKRRPR